MNKLIAVTIGDIKGIGIELLLKLWFEKKIYNFVLFTNKKIFDKYLIRKKIKINIQTVNQHITNLKFLNFNSSFCIYDIDAKNNEENTYNALIESYNLTKKKYFIGIITLPLNKNKIIKKINSKFIGQTELFQKLDKKNNSNMIFIYKDLIITILTTHIRLQVINKYLRNNSFIYDKIKLLYKTLNNDFKIKNPKILISGINPHAGEKGTIGKEEIKYLKPVLKKLKKNKILINGPISGDAVFTKNNINIYDCFICNFHDQGLIPFKILSNYSGINYTSGLNIIRVSPDHGTAYDLVGKNIAKIESLKNCFKFIHNIHKNRLKIVKS